MEGEATSETRDQALAPLVALDAERGEGWRWRWNTRPDGSHWKAELKVEEFGDFGWVTLAWFSSTGTNGELSALTAVVRYVLDHIARKDRLIEDGQAYQRRVAAGGRPI